MNFNQNLFSFHIVERQNDTNSVTWTYPTITTEQKKIILDKTFFTDKNKFTCRHAHSTFSYTNVSDNFALILLAKDFQPKKYKFLCDILVEKFEKTRNPVDLVTLYLNVIISGNCENGNQFSLMNFESGANLKEFIHAFDLKVILIYTALILKRGILVFHSDTNRLFEDILAITELVPRRKIEHLFPLIENVGTLKGLSFFLAGTTNCNYSKFGNVYDILVNGESGEIDVSPKAEGIMAMTKTHKDIATHLVKLSTSELSQKEVQKEISRKTNDLLSLLHNLTQNKMLSIEDLKSKNFHPKLENFLFHLAVAENMMVL